MQLYNENVIETKTDISLYKLSNFLYTHVY